MYLSLSRLFAHLFWSRVEPRLWLHWIYNDPHEPKLCCFLHHSSDDKEDNPRLGKWDLNNKIAFWNWKLIYILTFTFSLLTSGYDIKSTSKKIDNNNGCIKILPNEQFLDEGFSASFRAPGPHTQLCFQFHFLLMLTGKEQMMDGLGKYRPVFHVGDPDWVLYVGLQPGAASSVRDV